MRLKANNSTFLYLLWLLLSFKHGKKHNILLIRVRLFYLIKLHKFEFWHMVLALGTLIMMLTCFFLEIVNFLFWGNESLQILMAKMGELTN